MAKTSALRDTTKISQELAGQVVAEVSDSPPGSITIHFTSGNTLVVERKGGGVGAVLERTGPGTGSRFGEQPTRRQREYLQFIKSYMHRYGVAPAETDIQSHFMVSAPSVNSMVRTLEQRGFITRERDWFGQTVPRSIRVVWDE